MSGTASSYGVMIPLGIFVTSVGESDLVTFLQQVSENGLVTF